MMNRESREFERERHPSTLRPGTRTFLATTGPFEHWKVARVELDLDEVIEDETNDYRIGRSVALEGGTTAKAYALAQDDRAIWEETSGGLRHHLVAIIRPRIEGSPLVIRPDEWPNHVPETDDERHLWAIVKRDGAAAIISRIEAPPPPVPRPLAGWEESLLKIMRDIGEAESWDRLMVAGPYGTIMNAIHRLGTDAVVYLRKLAREAEDAESGVTRDQETIRRDMIERPPPLEDPS